MSGVLHVNLECGYSGDPAPGLLTQLVGNVYAATPGNPSFRHVRLPLGWDAPPAAFELPAGRYVVEAGLPSGQIFTEDVDVLDGQTAVVQFDVTGSPFESHTLQYVVGNIEPGTVYHRQDVYPVPNSLGSRSFSRREPIGPDSDVGPGRVLGPDSDVGPPPVEVALLRRGASDPPGIEALNLLRQERPAGAIRSLGALLRSPGPPVTLGPNEPMPLSPIFRFGPGADALVPDSDHRYQYVQVTSGEDAYLVTVPWPWPDEGSRSHVIEVLLNLRQSPTGSPVSVTVRDPAIGGGLGYLASGALEKAAVLFADVEAMLYGKVRNPLAAAAGGYVLIGTETSGQEQRWDRWLGNLRDWFPELSDGAILWGARRLRTARGPAELDEARDALLAGYHRGVPVYTLGLTWLIDGLSAFGEDPRCAEALQQVRQLCWRVDMREPFVVLRLGENR